jgi:hypothetical protein
MSSSSSEAPRGWGEIRDRRTFPSYKIAKKPRPNLPDSSQTHVTAITDTRPSRCDNDR